jgi:ABC-2 type transport system ATP-binding protein
MSPALEAQGLVKRFGDVVALDGFDLVVAAGEICGLVGHNGAGKTTFARAAAGLIAVDAGTLRVASHNVARDAHVARHHLGFAPQELSLYPTATARENLMLFAGLYGLPRPEAHRRIGEIAEAMALADVLGRRVRELSGGQQRRLQAATAMIHHPGVLLLDEPTVGADPVTREALLAVVRARADEGSAVVYTTHYLPDLETLGATLAVADHGRVIARGERAALLGSLPGHAVLGFDGPLPAVNLLAAGCREAETEGSQLMITAADPASIVASLVAAHPGLVGQLRTIEVRPPSLDDLYHHLVVSHAR